jgi:putative SOS response-associated peptidase YedK
MKETVSLDTPRWVYVPFWARNAKNGFKTINLRVEPRRFATPGYREAIKNRRCLMPVDSFYEGDIGVNNPSTGQ